MDTYLKQTAYRSNFLVNHFIHWNKSARDVKENHSFDICYTFVPEFNLEMPRFFILSFIVDSL
jgi:hypothetical protein